MARFHHFLASLPLPLPRQQRRPLAPGDISQLRDLRSLSWRDFQTLVADLYRKRGFTVGLRGAAKPDGGIDLIVRKNNRVSVVQCKQSRHKRIAVDTARDFLDLVADAGADRGYLVSTAGFTDETHAFALTNDRLRLITGRDLLRVIESVQPTHPEAAPDPVRPSLVSSWGELTQLLNAGAPRSSH